MYTAVLEGVYPGRIFVDHPDQPQTAFLSTFLASEAEGVWGFLAGHPTNVAFNRALNRAIFTREIVGPKTPIVFLTCDPQDWGGMLPAVSEPSHLMAMPRRRYVCRELHYDWRVHVPPGFTIQPMSTDLLRRPDLEVPDDVRLTIEKWRSAADPRFQDFGFVAIYETSRKASIAGWATVDCVVRCITSCLMNSRKTWEPITARASPPVDHTLNWLFYIFKHWQTPTSAILSSGLSHTPPAVK